MPGPILARGWGLFLNSLLDLFLQQSPWVARPRGVLEPLSRPSVGVLLRGSFEIVSEGLGPLIDTLSQVNDVVGIDSELVLVELPIIESNVSECTLERHGIEQGLPFWGAINVYVLHVLELGQEVWANFIFLFKPWQVAVHLGHAGPALIFVLRHNGLFQFPHLILIL